MKWLLAVCALALVVLGFLYANTEQSVSEAFPVDPAEGGRSAPPSATTASQAKPSADAPAQVPHQSQIKASRMKAVEGTLFANGVLSTGNLKVLSGDEKKFEGTIDRLAEDYYADPEASELTRIYKSQLDKALAASGKDVSLEKMACGLSVCAALFSGKDMSQIDFTATMMNSAQAGGAKLYSSTVTVVPSSRPGDPSTYRVFFATDPTANVIVEKR